MKNVIIYPMHCSREEFKELIDYLEKECWKYRIDDKGLYENNALYTNPVK